MKPRIQYVKTSDGVDIAYGTAGQGAPRRHTHLYYLKLPFR